MSWRLPRGCLGKSSPTRLLSQSYLLILSLLSTDIFVWIKGSTVVKSLKSNAFVDIVSSLLACTCWVNVTPLGQVKGITGLGHWKKWNPGKMWSLSVPSVEGVRGKHGTRILSARRKQKKMKRQFQWWAGEGGSFSICKTQCLLYAGLALQKQVCSTPRSSYVPHKPWRWSRTMFVRDLMKLGSINCASKKYTKMCKPEHRGFLGQWDSVWYYNGGIHFIIYLSKPIGCITPNVNTQQHFCQ